MALGACRQKRRPPRWPKRLQPPADAVIQGTDPFAIVTFQWLRVVLGDTFSGSGGLLVFLQGPNDLLNPSSSAMDQPRGDCRASNEAREGETELEPTEPFSGADH